MTRSERKPYAANPLKVGAPVGAAIAFMGVRGAIPLIHGAQGCTAFAKVLMVRHFREPAPVQTTAMSELTTILGGADNVEEAVETLTKRAKPELIGLCTTALTETRGEDLGGDLKRMRVAQPSAGPGPVVVQASCPDYTGSFQDGWAAAVLALIEALVEPADKTTALHQINLLPGSHLTPGDVEALKDLVAAFALEPVAVPDLADSLDGALADTHHPTSQGGVPVELIRRLGRARLTIAVGEQMRPAAKLLQQRTGVPFILFDRLTGLGATDALMQALVEVSGHTVPERLRRDRRRLQDAMIDGHFPFGGRRLAVAGEADTVYALSAFAAEMGATVAVAVTAADGPARAQVPAETVLVGDLDDLERHAQAAGCDLLIANSHGAAVAARLGCPLYRAGFPVLDRLGTPQRVSIGYRGTRNLLFDLANHLLSGAEGDSHSPVDRPDAPLHAHAPAQALAQVETGTETKAKERGQSHDDTVTAAASCR